MNEIMNSHDQPTKKEKKITKFDYHNNLNCKIRAIGIVDF